MNAQADIAGPEDYGSSVTVSHLTGNKSADFLLLRCGWDQTLLRLRQDSLHDSLLEEALDFIQKFIVKGGCCSLSLITT